MEFAFYICGLIAILATLRVVTHTNPVHALLYLIISLLAIAGVFFSLGAYFAGALEIIVYAGAIMVLFVFVVMMLNLGGSEIEQERKWLQPGIWIGPAILSAVLLVVIVYAILGINDQVDRRRGDQRQRSGYCAVWAVRPGGGAGLHAAAGGPGGRLPYRPRRARRRGAEQPRERQRQKKTEEHA